MHLLHPDDALIQLSKKLNTPCSQCHSFYCIKGAGLPDTDALLDNIFKMADDTPLKKTS